MMFRILSFTAALLMLVSCKEPLRDFTKQELVVKVSKEAKAIPFGQKKSQQKHKPSNYSSNYSYREQVKYNNKTLIYIDKDAKYAKLFNINTKKALLVGSNISQDFTVDYNSTKSPAKEKATIQTKKYPFNLIVSLIADNKDGFYVLELSDTDKKKKKAYFDILRFDKDANLMYKIGRFGKVSKESLVLENEGFKENGAMHLFYIDKNGYIYLIFKGIKKDDIRPFELYVFDDKGNPVVNKINLAKFIPTVAGYSLLIEDMLVSPTSQNMIALVAYYPLRRKTKEQFSPAFKRIYTKKIAGSDLETSAIKTVKTLRKESEINNSIFGIDENDNIFFFMPSAFTYEANQFSYTYYFNVLSNDSTTDTTKSLRLGKEKDEYTTQLTLGSDGEIAYFVMDKDKIISHFYK